MGYHRLMVSLRAGRRSLAIRTLGLLVALVVGESFVIRSGVAKDLVAASVAEAAQEHSTPDPSQVEALLGAYTAGRETLTLRWQNDVLILDLDRISVPVDGRWHETVPTFAVRHRVGWVVSRGVLRLEEQHNEGVHWRYELRFSDDRLDKVQLPGPASGEETLVRSYRRQP